MVNLDATTLLVFGGTALFVRWLLQEPDNLPPGPRRWPVIGSLLAMAKYPIEKGHLVMREMAEKYGGIFSLKVGSMWMVVIADPDIAREVFVKQADSFSDRPVYSGPMKKSKEKFGEFGVIWASGDKKKEIRKFTISAMREFGFGKHSLLERISEETQHLRHEIHNMDGQAWSPLDLIPKAVSNIICSICFGDRFRYDDPEFLTLMAQLKGLSESMSFVEISMVFEWLSFLPKSKRAKENEKWLVALFATIEEKIKQHEETYDPNETRDFVDLYLKHKHEEHGSVSADIMRTIVVDLYFAGSDTTSTALSWLLKFLIAHPQVQEKCRQEVDKVIGRERLPTMADKASMPYLEATINETLRLSSTAPTSIPHYAMESGTVNGYTIPQGCNVILSIYAINMDPKRWQEPTLFRPERWLDENGQCVTKNTDFVGFGIGPRMCLGEGLSRQELFLFFTSLLQDFTFHKENDDQQLDFEGLQGITLQPTAYQLVAKPR